MSKIAEQKLIKNKESSFQGFSSSTLKIIAMVTMVIDHFGLAIYTAIPNYSNEVYQVCRMIGRISFPIFCFLLVEGFRHTRNVWKYAGRLFVFALISEIPFDFAFHQTYFHWGIQNVFFTLFLALIGLIALKQWKENTIWNIIRKTTVVIIVSILGYAMKVDYKGYAVLYMILLYIFGNYDKIWMEIIGVLGYAHEMTAPLAFIPIHFYNGQRGIKLKYMFYFIYPVHLILFGAIRWWLLHS